MIALGAVVPGTHASAVNVLIVVGAGVVIIALLMPRFKEAELGVKGIRLVGGARSDPAPWLRAESATLSHVAELILQDREAAARVVERTIDAVRKHRTPISADDIDTVTFKTLVSFLESADERRWLAGAARNVRPENPIAALRLVDFPERIVYVLRQEGLRQKDVANILDRTPAEVEEARSKTRSTIAPFVDTEAADSGG